MPDISNVKIVKKKDGPDYAILLPVLSEAALDSYALNFFGKKLPRKADGTLDWDAFIDGEFILKS